MKSELNNEDHPTSQSQCPSVNLLDFLEAENHRLRQTVIELSLDTLALREALYRKNRARSVA
jgi:hypothetical protein